MAVAAAGWYDDPERRHQSRYWDGANWTSRVADDGVAGDDELDASASPPPPPGSHVAGPQPAGGAGPQRSPFYIGTDGQRHYSDTPPADGWRLGGRGDEQWVPPQSTAGWTGIWRGMSTKARTWTIVAIVAVLSLFLIPALGGGQDPDDDDLEFAAFDVCRQFVKERLRAPATAEFPDPTEDDGEVRIARNGERVFIVMSQVDSENGFGALLTTPFRCEVRHIEDTRFRLVDLQLQE